MTYQHKVIGVFAADPPFAYSVGLTKRGWPELLIIGIDVKAACVLINSLSERNEAPHGFLDLGGRFPLAVIDADPGPTHKEYTCQTEPNAPVRQLVLCDKTGKFPWDKGCAEPYASIPVLGKPPV